MRYIEFRGKRKFNNEWVQGWYQHSVSGWSHVGEYEVYPETVGEYTGRKDAGGKQIFEGDILLANEFHNNDGRQYVEVIYDDEHCMFYLRNNAEERDSFKEYPFDADLRVVGNIHDNEELPEAAE